jgi:hypothetical protein
METKTLDAHLRLGVKKGVFEDKIEMLISEMPMNRDAGEVFEDAAGNRQTVEPECVYGEIFTVAARKRAMIHGPVPYLLEAGDKIMLDKTHYGTGVGVCITKKKIPDGVEGKEIWTTCRRILEIRPC